LIVKKEERGGRREEGRRKREEGRRKREEGGGKKEERGKRREGIVVWVCSDGGLFCRIRLRSQ